MKLKVLLISVGIVQLVLGLAYLFMPHELLRWMGLAYLFMPHELLRWMGHSIPPTDLKYPLGMLAARFLAYGLGMLVIARAPAQHQFWIKNMVFIQVIDLAVGLFYTFSGTIGLTLSAFPMFNAALIALLLWRWRPRAASVPSVA